MILTKWFHFLLLTSIVIAGCEGRAIPATQPPTATTVRVVQAAPFPTAAPLQPTVERAIQAIEASPVPTAETPMGCVEEATIPLHTVEATLDYTAHTVAVQQRTRTINTTGSALMSVVFMIEPNRYPGIFTLEGVNTVDGDAPTVAAYELTGRRLDVELTSPLDMGCALALQLDFRLNITPIGQVLSATSGYLGYSARQFNLGLWLPTVAVYRDGAWQTPDPALVGEPMVYGIADWDVSLHVTNAPPDLIAAAPGTVVQVDAERWRIRHNAAREVTISLSPDYRVASAQTEGGVTVEAYTFNDALVNSENVPVDGAAHLLEVATEALGMYADLFGAYPYDRFVIIQADFRDGMEFSDLVFVGGEWFRTFPGSPASYLTIITVHEVAHQWWYARVGNDQALTPWLDEALATYSEYIYYEEYHPELKDWWWTFRVDTFLPRDYDAKPVNSSVYEFTSAREYINAVYLRGARMLHQLRAELGTDAFFDWLRRYADSGAGRVVSEADFWSLLSPAQREATAATRMQYTTGT
ncbi:MAG: M1 family metallopeptidase [Chloroflexota bacterium]|nr:M1 family metallopeptidase [Chloroflexota bacterium]